LEESQFGFRKNRGTIDAIYTLNYVANRELAKKKGKLFVFFMDLKSAFDRVDKGKLGEMLKERLRRRIMETYRETRNIIKMEEEITGEFWTKEGVRQDCPLSPTLFNIYIMDLESEMEKE